jgi:hypothetical protein
MDEENIIRPDDKFEFHSFLPIDDDDENIFNVSEINNDISSSKDDIIFTMLSNLTDLDCDDEDRENAIRYLVNINPDRIIEALSELVDKYLDTQNDIIKSVIENICNSIYTPFITKIEYAKHINNGELLYSIIKGFNYKEEDISHTVLWDSLLYLRNLNYDVNEEIKTICCNQTLDIEFRYKCIRSLEYNENNSFILFDFISNCFSSSQLSQTINSDKNFIVFILQIADKYKLLTEDYCIEIFNKYFINNEDITDYLKADFGDFLLNLNFEKNDKIKNIAHSLLSSISGDFKSLYHNKQNIHIVDVNISKFISILKDVKCTENEENTFQTILSNCNRFDTDKRNAIKLSLRRIQLDNGLYESFTLSGILYRLYWFIFYSNNSSNLYDILYQELSEEPQSCSSGHLIRLMNVLSGTTDLISVDPKIEFRDSFNYRLQKVIQNSEYSDEIMDGIMNQKEEKIIKYLYIEVSKIRDEMIEDYKNILSIEIIEEEIRKNLTQFTIV